MDFSVSNWTLFQTLFSCQRKEGQRKGSVFYLMNNSSYQMYEWRILIILNWFFKEFIRNQIDNYQDLLRDPRDLRSEINRPEIAPLSKLLHPRPYHIKGQIRCAYCEKIFHYAWYNYFCNSKNL